MVSDIVHRKRAPAFFFAVSIGLMASTVSAEPATPYVEANLAVGQCRILVATITTVPVWRDNGVPVQRAKQNVLGALEPFGPDSSTFEKWGAAVAAIYRSEASSENVRASYSKFCSQYDRLNIPVPQPR